jgi:RNA polymerase sigma factor (sigma-70 family)
MSPHRCPQQAHDELLALRCQLGERSAFDELIRRWALPLRRHVLRVSGDEAAADDLVQEIWLAVVRGIAGLRDPARLRAWLFGIAHRVLVDRMRARYASAVDAGIDLEAIVDDAPAMDRQTLAHAVERGLARVPLLEREVLDLFYLQELSLVDTAAALAIPVGTVKSRLFRAREALRVVLIDSEIAP